MNNLHQTDERIFQYLDGNMAVKEKKDFEDELKSDNVLKERFSQLKLIHDSLQANKLESPGINFTYNVMQNLAQAPIHLRLSPKNGLMLLLGVGIALILGVIFLSSGGFDQFTGDIHLEELYFPKKVIRQTLPSIPFNAGWVMKILIGLNLAIVFVLFDRTILHPFFRNRARMR